MILGPICTIAQRKRVFRLFNVVQKAAEVCEATNWIDLKLGESIRMVMSGIPFALLRIDQKAKAEHSFAPPLQTTRIFHGLDVCTHDGGPECKIDVRKGRSI